MIYKIGKNELDTIINLINQMGSTNMFTPKIYTTEVIPFLQKLQNLDPVENNESTGPAMIKEENQTAL